jgi:hypothetical protein
LRWFATRRGFKIPTKAARASPPPNVENLAERSELADAFALGVAFKRLRGSTPAEHRVEIAR